MRDLVFGQAKINEGINKKLAALDKSVESLNVKLDRFSSAQKSQLSFNKMLETQLAQLAALVPSPDNGRILGQPVSSCENVSVVSTRWGKPPRKTRASNYAGKPIQQIIDPWEESAVVHKKDPGYPTITCTIYYKKIRHALCDLGASVNLMSKAMFEQLGYPALSPTARTIQLADSTIR